MSVKILIVLKNYDGGTGTFARGLADKVQGLPRWGIQVGVVSLQKPQYLKDSTLTAYYSSKRKDRYQILKVGMSLVGEVWWLYKEIKKYQPGVVLAVDSHSIMLVEMVRTLGGNRFKSIHSIHNNLEAVYRYRVKNEWERKLIRQVMHWCLNRASAVVCVSKELAVEVSRYLNLKQIPQGIYNGLIPKQDLNAGKFQAAPIIFITVCRLDRQKDVITLIRAFGRMLNKSQVRVLLWIVGDGADKAILVEECKRLGIEKWVKFFGWQDPEDYLYKAHVYVLASHWEGLPYGLLEAMQAGLPVIAADCDFGPREILDEGRYGLLYEVGNEVELTKRMEEMLSLKIRERWAVKGWERGREFTLKKQVSEYYKLIEGSLR